jgi:hypothetical protein
MAKITVNNNERSSPEWAGDYFSRDRLVPYPARVNPAAFTADGSGRKNIPSGTALGRTAAEATAGTGFGPADAADDEIFLLAFEVTDAAINVDCELYRAGGAVFTNYLPAFSGLAAGVQTALKAKYLCTTATN